MKYIKVYLIIIFLLSFIVDNMAQNYATQAEAVSSGGGTTSNNIYSNFGVIGELVISNSINGGIYSNSGGFINTINEEAGPNFTPQSLSNIYTIRLHPNPVREVLYINCNELKPEKISIYNISGDKVLVVAYNNSIDISELVNGVYILKLINKFGETITAKKFYKE